MSRIALALLCGMIALAPLPGLADDGSADATLEEFVIRTAETARQHEALAHYYEGKAQEARSEARRHEKMGRAYRGTAKITQQNRMRAHCQKISKQYEEMAKEYDALAKLHAAEAR
ncbi:MAG TPA: hypothetical protein ENI85_18965 [Deltaproteobacteria bacterium]|nr:hypothetical protein [Deltaproteobacteria bacterium]